MGCASSVPASSIEAPVAWSSLLQAEAAKINRALVKRLLAALVQLVKQVEALPSCKERDTLLRQTWTVRVQPATWDEEAAQKATAKEDWVLMLQCQAACKNKLDRAVDTLNLYIVGVHQKVASKLVDESRCAQLEARHAALTGNHYDE